MLQGEQLWGLYAFVGAAVALPCLFLIGPLAALGGLVAASIPVLINEGLSWLSRTK
jgi:hypothetical protein